ncbi:MAG: hypothetical protein ACRC2H_01180 [Silanimonas sp.]
MLTFKTPGVFGFKPVSLFQLDGDDGRRSIPHLMTAGIGNADEKIRVTASIDGADFAAPRALAHDDSFEVDGGNLYSRNPKQIIWDGVGQFSVYGFEVDISKSVVGDKVTIFFTVEASIANDESGRAPEPKTSFFGPYIVGHVAGAETSQFILFDREMAIYAIGGEDDVVSTVGVVDAVGVSLPTFVVDVPARHTVKIDPAMIGDWAASKAQEIQYPIRIMIDSSVPGLIMLAK